MAKKKKADKFDGWIYGVPLSVLEASGFTFDLEDILNKTEYTFEIVGYFDGLQHSDHDKEPKAGITIKKVRVFN